MTSWPGCVAQQLQGNLGQPVVIDNKPGGGTTIGSKAAASAPPDGYTLLFSSSALVIEPALNKQMEYDPQKDFTPIAFIASNSCLLTVNAEVPANSVKEFVDYARANPGKLSLGFAQGTVSQLVGEYFNRLHGLDITSVPVPGRRAGHSRHARRPHHDVLADARDRAAAAPRGKDQGAGDFQSAAQPDLPQVPTMKELGIEELSLEYWAGMWAPAGTPADIVEKLNAAVNEALQSPELIASLKKLGFETRIGSPRDFAVFITAEIPRWAAVVKASGVKSQ